MKMKRLTISEQVSYIKPTTTKTTISSDYSVESLNPVKRKEKMAVNSEYKRQTWLKFVAETPSFKECK